MRAIEGIGRGGFALFGSWDPNFGFQANTEAQDPELQTLKPKTTKTLNLSPKPSALNPRPLHPKRSAILLDFTPIKAGVLPKHQFRGEGVQMGVGIIRSTIPVLECPNLCSTIYPKTLFEIVTPASHSSPTMVPGSGF